VLYAGGEHGVWVSLNGGTHWERLHSGMSTVSVHDLRIHPRDNDLIAATHGRGFYILDDLTPVQGFAQAHEAAAPALFQPRAAYTYFRWWAYEYGSGGPGGAECCPPANQFSGENPASGVALSYYLPQPAKSAPSLAFFDASGKAIAHENAPNAAGINRTSWDLSGDAAVPWRSARPWNQGPGGLAVVPGTYTVQLLVDGQSLSRTFAVRPDPRAHWTQEQYVERHAFLAELYDEVSQIDIALNDLDEIRGKLARSIAALRSAHAPAAQIQAAQQQLQQAQALSAEISSNPRNSEDNEWRPDKLRERVLTLIDVYGLLSQGPPLPAHRREAAEIKPIYDRAMADYRRFKRSLKGEA
jgi:chorismate mutase